MSDSENSANDDNLLDRHLEAIRGANHFYNGTLPHDQWIRELISIWATATEGLCAELNVTLAKHRIRVSFDLVDSKQFSAEAYLMAPDEKTGWEHWRVRISLACFTQAAQFSNALCMPDLSWSFHFFALQEIVRSLGESLGMQTVTPDGRQMWLTECMTLDALTLIFLHEIGHGLEGHGAYTPESEQEHRAQEALADARCGRVFSAMFSRLASPVQSAVKGTDADPLNRLSKGAFLLALLLEMNSTRSGLYHRPRCRLVTILWNAIDPRELKQQEAYYWMERILIENVYHMITVLYKLPNDRFCPWTMGDVSSDADFADYIASTTPVMLRIRAKLAPLLMMPDELAYITPETAQWKGR